MNKAIIVCFTTLLFTGALAQSTEHFGKLEFHEITYAKFGEVHTVLPCSDGSFYTISARGVTTEAHHINADLAHQESYTIESAYYRSGSENAGMAYTQIGERCYMIYAKDIKNSITLYAAELNNPGNVMTLGTIDFKERAKLTLEELLLSPSKTKLAIHCNVQTAEVAQSYVFLFDHKLGMLAKYVMDKPEEIRIRELTLSDMGQLYCLDIKRSEAEKKRDSIEGYSFKVFHNGAETAHHHINDLTSTASSACITIDADLVHAYVFTSEDKEVTVDGKKEKKADYVLNHWKFNSDLNILHEAGNKISRAVIEKLQTHDKMEGKTISLKGAFLMRDGSSIIIADASTYRPPVYEYKYNKLQNKDPAWYYTGIMIIHLDPSGNLKDTKSFHRKFYGVVYMVMPVIPVRMADSVLFTYIDEDKSIHVVNAFVNTEGILDTRVKTYTNDDLDKRAIIQETMVSDGNKNAYAVVAFKNEVVRISVD